jgi:hypothetical protein
MIDKKFNTNDLVKIGFKQSDNAKVWNYTLNRNHNIAYHYDMDSLFFSDCSEDELFNIDLKIYSISDLIRRLPLLTDFALLIETYE